MLNAETKSYKLLRRMLQEVKQIFTILYLSFILFSYPIAKLELLAMEIVHVHHLVFVLRSTPLYVEKTTRHTGINVWQDVRKLEAVNNCTLYFLSFV